MSAVRAARHWLSRRTRAQHPGWVGVLLAALAYAAVFAVALLAGRALSPASSTQESGQPGLSVLHAASGVPAALAQAPAIAHAPATAANLAQPAHRAPASHPARKPRPSSCRSGSGGGSFDSSQ